MSEPIESESSKRDGSCHRGILNIGGDFAGYEYEPAMTTDPVGGQLWTITDGIYRTIAIEGDQGLIAFDTFWSPGSARQYRRALERHFPRKRVHTIIYTHDHIDHTGFGADFAPEADQILAHELTAAVVEARGSDGQLLPTQVWSGERKLMDIDGAIFELIYPGPTHGTGNTAAYFPEQKFLYMADTVIPGATYTVVPDWAWTNWIPNTRRLLGLDWDRYAPGHFWQLSRREFEADFELWDATAGCALEALQAGVDVDDFAEVRKFTYEKLDAPFGYRVFRFDEFMAVNVLRHMIHYKTGSWGLSDYEPYSTEPFRTTPSNKLGSLA
ncbi:MBL fold metallo-hydrolase [Mycolicibacterium sp. XJ2546]